MRKASSQPLFRVEFIVHRIKLVVSFTHASTPADFAAAVKSFSSFSHRPGWPPLLLRQAFHSFFKDSTLLAIGD